MEPISKQIHKIICRIFKNEHYLFPELIMNWNKIVGIKFSAHTSPLRIYTQKEKSNIVTILEISVANPAVSTAISFQQDIIIERIAVYLGSRVINRLRLKVI